MQNVPLIIPYFNQPTYLSNLIMWWKWYGGEQVYVLDNGNNCNFKFPATANIRVINYEQNDCAGNLKKFIEENINGKYEYYVISDPDIMPHPNTHPKFLEIFKQAINSGFHRAGFDLMTEDIPEWNSKKAHIQHDEKEAGVIPVTMETPYGIFGGRKAALDTTFCMYSTKNGGWYAPMSGKDWSNSLRIFKAFHLPYYLHDEYVNDEMDKYFTSCKFRDLSPISAGKNNWRPKKYRNE